MQPTPPSQPQQSSPQAQAPPLHNPPQLSARILGAAPGIDLEQLLAMPDEAGDVLITCIDFNEERYTETDIPIADLNTFLDTHRPEWVGIRWINVAGLTNKRVIHALARKYQLHPLAIEDMVQGCTRPKVESFPGGADHHARTFIVARKIHHCDEALHCEQVNLFAGEHTLLTFQSTHQGVWDPVRDRIRKDGSRLRRRDLGYLVYALLDAVVDHCFPVVDRYCDRLHALGTEVLENVGPGFAKRVHPIKNELLLLRREILPMRDVIHKLQQGEHENISETTAVYLRDVHDHLIQLLDMVETYRELADGLMETYQNSTSQRLNEVMKVLTIIATIFMPISFLAAVFGMNFQMMPELNSTWAYPWAYPIGFWTICLASVSNMLFWLRKNRWL